jgi:Cof subfamily protein (haloacid dehalogenase superfamily)
MNPNQVICTDLDGTLFYPKHRIRLLSNRNRKFLKKFFSDGGRLLLVSSRSSYMSHKVAVTLKRPLDAVCCNGSFVVCGDKIIKETFFDTVYLKKILADMRQNYDPPLILLTSKARNLVMTRTNVSHFTNIVYFLYNLFQGVYKDPFVRSDHIFAQEIERGKVYKMMVMIGLGKKNKTRAMEINRMLREKYPEAEFSWIGEFIEITPKGCSKSQGIAFYLEYNQISKDNVIVVGDSGNDISMFAAYPENSYCMAHANDHVQKHAKHIIKRFSDLEDVLYPSEDSNHPKKEERK